jgi:acetoin utilization deacetylase AcuC-like enzyme
MNERIFELAEQAQKVVGYTDGGYTEIKALDQEKFAELIVQDCIDNVKTWEKDSRNHISYMLKNHYRVGK